MLWSVRDIYQKRFLNQVEKRDRLWSTLCSHFFQRHIPLGSTVLDLGAGYCEFINNISAGKKIAVDINPDMLTHADKDVQCIQTKSTELGDVGDDSVDVVFTSNFLEHLEKSDILATLKETRRVLKVGGKVILLQPNIRYCYRDYWMFFDHLTPLDHHSLAEVLTLDGFEIRTLIPRFLPYSTKSGYPINSSLIKIYLAIPLIWRLIGGQMLIIAEKR